MTIPLQVVTTVSSASTQCDVSSIIPPPQNALHCSPDSGFQFVQTGHGSVLQSSYSVLVIPAVW